MVINIVDPKARTRPSWKSGRPPWGGNPGGLDRICDDAQVTPPSVVKKTRGPNSLSSAGTKPCCASMNDTLPLQGVGTMPIDGAGHTLSGERDFILHFPPGGLPPNDAFWSLTMADAK